MRKLQQGFTLIAAIFLIVVLAVLGAYMVAISATQHQTVALAAQGAQGYYAARSGIEWGAYRALNGQACSGTHSFAGYTVDVSCTMSTHSQAGGDMNIWAITSTASKSSFGELDHVSRTLSITIADG